jgi:hypothetical protein
VSLSSVIILTCAVMFLSSCAAIFSSDENLARSDQELAVLNNGCGCVERIWRRGDGAPVYERSRDGAASRFRLTPGVHEIHYAFALPRIGSVSRGDLLELKAGRVYTAKSRWCDPLFSASCRRRPAALTLWIEDDIAGTIVAGERWD